MGTWFLDSKLSGCFVCNQESVIEANIHVQNFTVIFKVGLT